MQRPIQRPISRAIASGLLTRPGGFNPLSLFTDGSVGVWYDQRDLSTFYQDSAGTIPAVVNDVLGLQLDKSAGLALGAELLGTGAVGLTGSATVATYNTGTGAGTVTRVDGANQSFVTFTGLSATSFYQVTIQNTGSNILSFRRGTFASTILGDIGVGETKTFIGLATISQLTITMSPVAGSGAFTVVGFKSLAGNHRYQSTTGSKPILRGSPVGANLVTNGDFASATGWTVGAGWAITGGQLVATAATGIVSRTLALTGGRVYRLTVGANTAALQLRFVGGTGQSITFASGVPTVVYFTYTAGAGNTFEIVANGTTTGIVDNVEIHDVTADVVTAPYMPQHDGVDDFLLTASVDFSATDKMFACMGVNKLSDASVAVFVELSADTNSNAGAFYMTMPNNTSGINAFVSRGSILPASGASSTIAAPFTGVFTGIADIAGDSQIQRRNGTQVGSSALDQGTGNFGNYPLYFGRRGGASLPFNGLDRGCIIVNKIPTAAQIAACERLLT